MKLYIGNIPFDAREDELRELLAPYGTPSKTVVIVDQRSGRSRGFGFVDFDDPAQAKAAIAGAHAKEFGGRTLVVNEARAQGGGYGDRRGPRGAYGGNRGGSEHGDRDGGRGRVRD